MNDTPEKVTQQKTRTIKPTAKQRKLARLMSENVGQHVIPKTQEQLFLSAGYSKSISTQQSNITKSQGFLMALDELGLTDEFVVSSLVEDIRAKPQRRAFELSIAAKIRGLDRRADEGQQNGIRVNNAVILVQAPSDSTPLPKPVD